MAVNEFTFKDGTLIIGVVIEVVAVIVSQVKLSIWPVVEVKVLIVTAVEVIESLNVLLIDWSFSVKTTSAIKWGGIDGMLIVELKVVSTFNVTWLDSVPNSIWLL